MGAKITVRNNQNVLDVCLQASGGYSSVFDLCLINDVSITDSIPGGKDLLTDIPLDNQDILGYYLKESIVPATGSVDQIQIPVLEGIDYWAVGVDFIVS